MGTRHGSGAAPRWRAHATRIRPAHAPESAAHATEWRRAGWPTTPTGISRSRHGISRLTPPESRLTPPISGHATGISSPAGIGGSAERSSGTGGDGGTAHREAGRGRDLPDLVPGHGGFLDRLTGTGTFLVSSAQRGVGQLVRHVHRVPAASYIQSAMVALRAAAIWPAGRPAGAGGSWPSAPPRTSCGRAAVLEAMKSNVASSGGKAGNYRVDEGHVCAGPGPRSRGRAGIRSLVAVHSRSRPGGARPADRPSGPSPQPTSSALPQPGGTAASAQRLVVHVVRFQSPCHRARRSAPRLPLTSSGRERFPARCPWPGAQRSSSSTSRTSVAEGGSLAVPGGVLRGPARSANCSPPAAGRYRAHRRRPRTTASTPADHFSAHPDYADSLAAALRRSPRRAPSSDPDLDTRPGGGGVPHGRASPQAWQRRSRAPTTTGTGLASCWLRRRRIVSPETLGHRQVSPPRTLRPRHRGRRTAPTAAPAHARPARPRPPASAPRQAPARAADRAARAPASKLHGTPVALDQVSELRVRRLFLARVPRPVQPALKPRTWREPFWVRAARASSDAGDALLGTDGTALCAGDRE